MGRVHPCTNRIAAVCKTPKMPAVKEPTRYAAMKTPNRGQTVGAGQRMSDSVRGAQSTILTSPLGAMDEAETAKKTLLGA